MLNYTASIDKIKLVCKLSEKSLALFYDAILCEKYRSFFPNFVRVQDYINNPEKLFTYRYNVVFKKVNKDGTINNDITFYVGLCYNGGIGESLQDNRFVIEFNPNKIGRPWYQDLRYHFNFKIIEIKYIDLAFDILNKGIEDLWLNTRADIMTYGTIANKTIYISPKGKTNRIKIYRKDLERNDNREKTLRIEISIGADILNKEIYNNHAIDKIQPYVDRLNSVYVLNMPTTTDVTLFMLLNLDEPTREVALSLMGKDKRIKYKKMLSQHYDTFDFDVLTFVSLLTDLLKFYK